ncbi:MAG: Maf family protein [Phenylobacterium sp.]|nr:Maf family protein [Phenylobacterium sp.]
MTLILASKSAARRAVLDGAGIVYEAASPGVDEDEVKIAMLAEGAGPAAIAEVLAERKAVAISRTRPGYVIGADQTLDLDGQLHDKAEDLSSARDRLALLRGRTHKLHSAVVVARDGAPVWRALETASLTMRDFSDAFLDDYLRTEGSQALGSVGCYRLEGPGAQLFERIEGDYFSILGLPLLGLLAFLRGEGVLAA